MTIFTAIWSGICIGVAISAIAVLELRVYEMKGRHVQRNPHKREDADA